MNRTTALDFDLSAEPRRLCRVRVGGGALGCLVEDLVAAPPGRPLVIVSDDRVARLHGHPLRRRLARSGLAVSLLEFPAGERSKTRRVKQRLEDELFGLGVDRGGAIVAVGGGVTGDLAGFVAATWHRGIPVVQVPTSLLAMVDAALGGKTAVNLPGGKNLVGAFHQPWGIYADLDLLETLPDDRFREGLAEAVKSAVIADAAFFRWLEGATALLNSRDAASVGELVVRCMRIKTRVVRRDAREAGRRAILNFGHTVAHALERVSRYRMRHGNAVAIGMTVEARLAEDRTGLPAEDGRRLVRLLKALRLPVRVPPRLSIDAIVSATQHDKKARAGRVRYALPQKLGQMPPGEEATVALDDRSLRRALVAGR